MRKCLENESRKTTPFTDCQFVDWVGSIFSVLLLFLPRILTWMGCLVNQRKYVVIPYSW